MTRSYMAGDQVKVIESVERVGSVGMVKNGDVSRKPIDTSGQNSNKPAISLTEYDTVYSGLFSNVESSKSVYAETSSEGSINSEGKSKLFSDDLRSRAQTRYDAFLERSELVELLKTFSRDELFELPTEVKFFVLGALLSAVVVASLTEAQKFAEAANVKYEDDRTLPTSAEKPPFFASVKVATVKKPTFRLSQTIPSAPSPKLVHSNITATGSVVESKSILFLSEYVKEELPTIPVGADTTLKPSSMKAVLKNAGQNMLADKISLKRKLFEVEEKEFMPSSTFSVNGVENYVEAIARVVSGTVGRIETTSKIACNVNERLIRNSKLVVDKFLAVNGDKIIALIFPREPSQDSRLARARTASVEGSVESTGKTSVGDCKFLSTYHEQCPPGQLLNGEYPGESFPTLTANTDETDSLLTANEAPSKSLSPTGPYLEMLSGNYGSNRR